MYPLLLGSASRSGERYYHDWESAGGHLDVSYSYHLRGIREPWVRLFLSAPDVDIVAGGPLISTLRREKSPLLDSALRSTRDPVVAIRYVERIAVRRIREQEKKGRWNGSRVALIIDGAESLPSSAAVESLARLIRVGSDLGISVLVFRSTATSRITDLLYQGTHISYLRLGMMLEGRYREVIAPNRRAAVLQPVSGRKLSFVIV